MGGLGSMLGGLGHMKWVAAAGMACGLLLVLWAAASLLLMAVGRPAL